MSPMTFIRSHNCTWIPILSNENDEKSGEQIVALFIAHVDSLRRAQSQSDICTMGDTRQIQASESEVCLETLNDLSRSLGPNNDPRTPRGLTEAQGRLPETQKERVSILWELESYREMESRLWI
jgi:hypothetical protein